jgi:hypothetical protein
VTHDRVGSHYLCALGISALSYIVFISRPISFERRSDQSERHKNADGADVKLCITTACIMVWLSCPAIGRAEDSSGCRTAGATSHSEGSCIKPAVVAKGNPGNYSKPVEKARRAVLPLSAKVLAIGMTDTQVLNLPSCGPPARIARTRESTIWHEEWTYQARSSGNDERVLYFENGRLVKEAYVPQPDPIEAQATIQ